MKDDLFPEAELRAFLKAAPVSSQDSAFEAAVLARIRREERLAALIPAIAALISLAVIVVEARPLIADAATLWNSAVNFTEQFLNALRPLSDALSTLIACAPSLETAVWFWFGPLIRCFPVVLLFIAVAPAFLRRFSLRTNRLTF